MGFFFSIQILDLVISNDPIDFKGYSKAFTVPAKNLLPMIVLIFDQLGERRQETGDRQEINQHHSISFEKMIYFYSTRDRDPRS